MPRRADIWDVMDTVTIHKESKSNQKSKFRISVTKAKCYNCETVLCRRLSVMARHYNTCVRPNTFNEMGTVRTRIRGPDVIF